MMRKKERNLKILNAVLPLSTCKARPGTEDKPHIFQERERCECGFA